MMAEIFTETEIMPLLFLGHGSPMNAIEENEFVKGWREIAGKLPRPKAILCISAHWETNGTYVTAMEKPETIHDFGGFPRKLYEVQYPAPGSPGLAKEIKALITRTDTGLDYKWGLDHGCWSVLKSLFPDADVPVIQLSLDFNRTAQNHYELARELAPLRKRGILIIGSGNIVHNLRLIAWDKLNSSEYGYDWAVEAKEEMKKYILNGELQKLINYQEGGRAFNLAIPTPEHYLPLLYILALKGNDEKLEFFNDKIVGASLAMTS
ncbi:MAG: 4,5-DOPA dioxygenase extradiol, partial [Bacteroidota bacterium]|nr:4,5-DOPA dioxygenase extradiol [Bacteroidota bacterium]